MKRRHSKARFLPSSSAKTADASRLLSGVQMKEGGNWEATIKSLALLPENKAFGDVP
jgi:hypothetical protein